MTAVCKLDLSGDVTSRPDTHVAHFIGDHPCHRRVEVSRDRAQFRRGDSGPGPGGNHSFSAKPAGGYSDFHHKLTTYVNLISAPALAIDPPVTARTYLPVTPLEEESVCSAN